MPTLVQDLRYGLRMLAKNPGFAAVAVLTLALGIGANTAIFSLIDAVMLQSLPVRDPSRLVLFRWQAHHTPNGEYSSFGDCPNGIGGANASGCSFPLPVFEQIRSEVKVFSGVTAFAGPAQLDLTGNGSATIASGEIVDGTYFSTLGVNAAIGRTLGPDDDSPSAPSSVVLSYAYWQSAFGGERSVIGRTILLNKVPFTIVGVVEPSFTHLSPGKKQDFWLPIADVPQLGISWGRNIRGLDNWWLVMLARLKPGVFLGKAQAAANLIFRNQILHGAKPVYKGEDDPTATLTLAQEGLAGRRKNESSRHCSSSR